MSMRNTDYWAETLTIGWMIPSGTNDPSIMVFILTFIKKKNTFPFFILQSICKTVLTKNKCKYDALLQNCTY